MIRVRRRGTSRSTPPARARRDWSARRCSCPPTARADLDRADQDGDRPALSATPVRAGARPARSPPTQYDAAKVQLAEINATIVVARGPGERAKRAAIVGDRPRSSRSPSCAPTSSARPTRRSSRSSTRASPTSDARKVYEHQVIGDLDQPAQHATSPRSTRWTRPSPGGRPARQGRASRPQTMQALLAENIHNEAESPARRSPS